MEVKEHWARPQWKQTICPYRIGFWFYSLCYQAPLTFGLVPAAPEAPRYHLRSESTLWAPLAEETLTRSFVIQETSLKKRSPGLWNSLPPLCSYCGSSSVNFCIPMPKDGILGETSEGLHPRERMADKNGQITLYLAGWNGTCFLLQHRYKFHGD